MEIVGGWGIDLILALQNVKGLEVPMKLITFTGSVEFFLLILPVIYWLVNRQLGVQMAVLLLLSILVGSLLKMILHEPRPYWVNPQILLLSSDEPTFGLPSIHTINAVVIWTLLAHYLQRTWVWVAAIALIFLAGVARVYLGVHFPGDVIAGWSLGVVLLFCRWRSQAPFARWFRRLPLARSILLGLLISLLFVVAGVIALRVGTTTLQPNDVRRVSMFSNALILRIFGLADIVTIAGVALGLTAGVVLCEQWGGFAIRSTLLQHVGSYFVGVIGVLLLWQGLDLLFTQWAPDESVLGYVLRYVRYSLIGFWIFGLAPLLFVKLRLARTP